MFMQFGLFGGAKAASGGPKGDSQAYGDFIAYVLEAEAQGFRSVFLVEHHFTGFGQVSASLALLSYLAAATKRIRLGTAVVVLPWHNPVLVAEEAATLDLLSNGRFDFGVGKGYRESEFSGFCVPITEATERFDEAIEVIRKAWTSQGRFSHHGARWHYDNIVVEPAPVQRPHPPFWLGAGSEESIRRAAREGYNLLLDQIGSIDLTIARVAMFREECAKVGRPYDPMMVGATRAFQLIRDEDERPKALAVRTEVLKNIGGLARGPGAARYSNLKEVSGPPIEIDDAPLLGTSAEIIARLKRLEAGGVHQILLVDPSPSVANLRSFAREVMPEFTASPVAAG
jgi:alkanesulfonate monooxygenase SsuD/methylene tetrahydromethanopterin reductase-like flavin-dependent oxidoreductase (luciferase family)